MSGVGLRPLGFGSRMAVVVIVTVYAAFSLGGVAGADDALDPSIQTPPDASELNSVGPEVREAIRGDLPAPIASAYIALVNPLVDAIIWFGKIGIRFGYQFPTAGAVNGHIAPIAVMGIVAVMVKRRLAAISEGVR